MQARPVLECACLKPLCRQSGGVFWIIVLLEYPLSLCHFQLLKTFHHSIIQTLTVLLCIHDPLNLCACLPHSTNTPSYHGIISSSMLDSGCGCPVRKCFSLFGVYTLPSDPILLILVSSDHMTLFQSATVQFSWY